MMSYDIANPSAETKEERHSGAIVKLVLEEDAEIIAKMKENSGGLTYWLIYKEIMKTDTNKA